MTEEDDVPIKMKHYSADGVWHRRPAVFWKPVTLLGIAAIIFAIPFLIILILLMNLWGWLRGWNNDWDVDDVEEYLRSIINTTDLTRVSCLIDDLECLYLYKPLTDPFLDGIRLRCQKNVEDSGWGGPGGFVDREGLRLILDDVQAYQREQDAAIPSQSARAANGPSPE